VRKSDTALADQLNQVIEERRDDIEALLRRYGVPLVQSDDATHTARE
jgi:hypothetical protein